MCGCGLSPVSLEGIVPMWGKVRWKNLASSRTHSRRPAKPKSRSSSLYLLRLFRRASALLVSLGPAPVGPRENRCGQHWEQNTQRRPTNDSFMVKIKLDENFCKAGFVSSVSSMLTRSSYHTTLPPNVSLAPWSYHESVSRRLADKSCSRVTTGKSVVPCIDTPAKRLGLQSQLSLAGRRC